MIEIIILTSSRYLLIAVTLVSSFMYFTLSLGGETEAMRQDYVISYFVCNEELSS